jgi:hypothetical protein
MSIVSSCLHVYDLKALEELSHVRKSGAKVAHGLGMIVAARDFTSSIDLGRSLSRIAVFLLHI